MQNMELYRPIGLPVIFILIDLTVLGVLMPGFSPVVQAKSTDQRNSIEIFPGVKGKRVLVNVTNNFPREGLSGSNNFPHFLRMEFYYGNERVLMVLTKNSRLDNVPIYDVQENGQIQLMSNDEQARVVGHYQCSSNGASFVVSYNVQTSNYMVEGEFIHKGNHYQIKPEVKYDGAIGKISRLLRYKLPEHIIENVKILQGTRTDYLESTLKNQYKIRNQHGRSKRETTNNQPQLYEVETLVVVDFSLVDYWVRKTPGNNITERVLQATANIKKYFSFIINSVDLRYQSIQENDITYRILSKGILIFRSPATSPWTENHKVNISGEMRLDAGAALVEFKTWLKTANVPYHDHAMLFTDYRFSQDGLAGLSYVGGICSDDSVSISTNEFDFQSAMTAAHELGHNLGAIHDEDTAFCNEPNRFIMATSYDPEFSSDNVQNPWRFSTCSITDFRLKLQELNLAGSNCLLVRSTNQFEPKPVEIPGQVFSVDDLCFYSHSSYLCRSAYNITNLSQICSNLLCATSEIECQSVVPPFGTPCGNKKWCVEGLCVDSNDALEIDESCPYGDSPGFIESNRRCSDMITDSYNCYNDNFLALCCKSCEDIRIFDPPGCLYGDKHPDCSGIAPYQCYISTVESLCCLKCPMLLKTSECVDQKVIANVPWPDCKYGDRLPNCAALETYQCYSNEDLCCETCCERQTGVAGCEYGDKNPECATIERHLCYAGDNNLTCCQSCQKLCDGPPGCECGNRDSGCDDLPLYVCYDQTYKDSCCERCNAPGNAICPYGDKSQNCTSLERRYCYVNFNSCCSRCLSLQDNSYPDCPFGDRAEPNSCSYLSNAKHDCYNVNVSKACCETCRNLEDPNSPDCKFGDEFPDTCALVFPGNCYRSEVSRSCCKRCQQFYDPLKTGCEYGDKVDGCLLNSCSDVSYRELCCSTCSGYSTRATTTTIHTQTTTKTTTSVPTQPTTKATTTPTQPTTKATTPVSTQPTTKATTTPTQPTTKTTTTPTQPTTKATTPTQPTTKTTTSVPTQPTTKATTPTQPTTKTTTSVPTQPTTKATTPTQPTTKTTTTQPTTKTTTIFIHTISKTKTTTKTSTTKTQTTTTSPQNPTSQTKRTVLATKPPITRKTIPQSTMSETFSSTVVPNQSTGPSGPQLLTEHYIGIGVGGFALIALVILLVWCCIRRRPKTNKQAQNIGNGNHTTYVSNPSTRNRYGDPQHKYMVPPSRTYNKPNGRHL